MHCCARAREEESRFSLILDRLPLLSMLGHRRRCRRCPSILRERGLPSPPGECMLMLMMLLDDVTQLVFVMMSLLRMRMNVPLHSLINQEAHSNTRGHL